MSRTNHRSGLFRGRGGRIVWVAAVIVLLAYVGYRGALQWRIHGYFRAMEEAGYPTTLIDLDASYVLPAGGQNAAADIARAAKVFAEIEQGDLSDEFEEWAALEELDRKHEAGEIDQETYFAEFERLLAAQEEEFNRETEVMQEYWALDDRKERGEIDEATYAQLYAELKARAPEMFENPTDYLADDLPEGLAPLDDDWRVGLAEALDKHGEILAHLRKAAAKGSARFPIDFARWEENTDQLDHARPIRDGARLLQRDAVLKSDSGDLSGAATSIKDALHIAETSAREPTLLMQLVRTSSLGIALEGLEFVLNRGALSQDQLDSIQDALPGEPVSAGYARGYRGECCLTRNGFKIRSLRQGDWVFTEVGDFAEVAGSYWSWRLVYEIPYALAGLQQWDHIRFLARARAADELFALPPAERWQQTKTVAQWTEAPPPAFLLGSQSCLIFPMPIVTAALRIDTLLDVARCVLAVEAYRVETGTLPGALSDLIGRYLREVPLDPFDGAPLRYRREDVGYVVYSIGQDEVDNGGLKLDHFAKPGGDYPMRIRR